jgi:hypothetical protein
MKKILRNNSNLIILPSCLMTLTKMADLVSISNHLDQIDYELGAKLSFL